MNMLQGSPWLLAHRSMLKSNQPKKVLLYGRDYVLWQDYKGEIHALSNACPTWAQCCLKAGAWRNLMAVVRLLVLFMHWNLIRLAQRCYQVLIKQRNHC
ncbi:Rieske 2Fe-2S domain-containing protein [Leptolyngbya boryana]|uniref:Rieske 2Fe-2S domain-containing protein n=1 Tax=Leptolyngbya boryana TaxID=1184 RepID=UPI0037443B90